MAMSYRGSRPAHRRRTTDLGVSLGRLVVADLNGDGVPDLAAETAAPNAQTLLLTGNGNGTFTMSDTLPAAPGGFLVVADLDHVPPLDLVGQLGVIYRAGTDLRTDEWPMLALDVRDITGDGHPDVLGVGFSVQARPRSNAVFAITSQVPVPPPPGSLRVAQFATCRPAMARLRRRSNRIHTMPIAM
jgi:hypothetical protein